MAWRTITLKIVFSTVGPSVFRGLWFVGVFGSEEVICYAILMIRFNLDIQIQDGRHLQNGSFQTSDPISENTWKYIGHTKVFDLCLKQKTFKKI